MNSKLTRIKIIKKNCNVFQALIAAANSEKYNRVIKQPRQTTLCSERKLAGLICENCDRLAFCVQISNIWQTYPVEPCDISEGQFCNIYEEKCSDAPGPCNRFGYEENFPCTSDGIFPDPYDCQIYHMCYQAEPNAQDYLPIAGTARCEGNRAYSVISNDCSLTLLDDVCKRKQYTCSFPGESHFWPNNPNIFYICQPEVNNRGKYYLYPTLYRCAPGEIYVNSTCLSKTEHNTTETPSINKTTFSTEKSSDILCDSKFGLREDPKDCNSYYYCTLTSEKAVHQTCPEKTFFDKHTLSCTLGHCKI
ncbi:uncharacterized protein LOC129609221 [Condylostylus longicornis]|uniref:uncharacterized protein LOC129609221 n=1 Tax=Condylostylus longicornis TaxID=2530218 RepID=UPI00244DD341|nr:uncharacterized protein LOC129609221 [Condylostylus longicornis]